MDKITLVNNHIEELINELIHFKKSIMDGVCCGFSLASPEDCIGINCTECKSRYFEAEKTKLIKKYRIDN